MQKSERSNVVVISVNVHTTEMIQKIWLKEIDCKEFYLDELIHEELNVLVFWHLLEQLDFASALACRFIELDGSHIISPEIVFPFDTVLLLLTHLMDHVPYVRVVEHLYL